MNNERAFLEEDSGALLVSLSAGFKIKEEWSYFEEPDVRPSVLKLFRHSKALSRTQYTVIADIR